jgi:hypothetical protein
LKKLGRKGKSSIQRGFLNIKNKLGWKNEDDNVELTTKRQSWLIKGTKTRVSVSVVSLVLW